MFLLGTCQAKWFSPCNVPDMFLPVSRYPCPQCQRFRSPSHHSLVLLFFPSALVPCRASSTTPYVLDPRVAFTFPSCLDLVATPPPTSRFRAPSASTSSSTLVPVTDLPPFSSSRASCSGGSLPTEEGPRSLSLVRVRRTTSVSFTLGQ